MKKLAQSMMSVLPFTAVALLTLSMILARQGKAHEDERKRTVAETVQVHGGQASVSKEHCFETVFRKNEIRIYPYNADAKPISTASLGGAVVLKPAKAGEPLRTLTLKPVASQRPDVRTYLLSEDDFSRALKDSFTAQITVTGFGEAESKEASFEVPFAGLTRETVYRCPSCETEHADPGKCRDCGRKLVVVAGVAQASAKKTSD